MSVKFIEIHAYSIRYPYPLLAVKMVPLLYGHPSPLGADGIDSVVAANEEGEDEDGERVGALGLATTSLAPLICALYETAPTEDLR